MVPIKFGEEQKPENLNAVEDKIIKAVYDQRKTERE
jgi:hypothetical protein